ncbi:MAG: hypothetical protein A3H52_00665 [Candidatus Zambryskibacteria bacterium RIFCSPLOWO2_02_FULL_39_26]|uniref:Uncharacterized protein n=1 Tax=Candidatus Zambryskibacteria bacterium RIFCSPLOWO2_12_FULL_39_23 TaxID=1802776 RepID=A0A1G2UR38_9BACT|nr:MAG: hypothetical protein A2W51_02975 [Candidatus Zambryskibacteria bacterium RIFCSPHIGHO2_02_39_10]OHA99272.1 MAG: hypothetical protein A3E59_01770 [Candidatus Zambryskibacteria bacterium RIFCSPHIGHO2_12_FULL_39_47]OHB09907.1 MAG: hypothetical protein A3H52_00665 [Candidatus Zambryskibacteria bacterium RIFCSPLOWO2_02_FULL_39_26]OHB11834.1 MAG: hypothetical protein A3G99_03310 [Candidatus Zambryskibacteria bacterium RIFCSPLOWO2_12_FULL_39_23]
MPQTHISVVLGSRRVALNPLRRETPEDIKARFNYLVCQGRVEEAEELMDRYPEVDYRMAS